jgi:hypothetical protein
MGLGLVRLDRRDEADDIKEFAVRAMSTLAAFFKVDREGSGPAGGSGEGEGAREVAKVTFSESAFWMAAAFSFEAEEAEGASGGLGGGGEEDAADVAVVVSEAVFCNSTLALAAWAAFL